jgi:hypothetical protein
MVGKDGEPTGGSVNAEELTGHYTYRSYLNRPEPVDDFNKLRFAQLELRLSVQADGTVTGTLIFPAAPGTEPAVMDVSGTVSAYPPRHERDSINPAGHLPATRPASRGDRTALDEKPIGGRTAAADTGPDPLHAMPSALPHEALRRLTLHHISPAQRGSGTRRRDVTLGCVLDRC